MTDSEFQKGDIVRIKNSPKQRPLKVITYLNGYYGLEYPEDNYAISWRKAHELVLVSRPKQIQSGAESTNS